MAESWDQTKPTGAMSMLRRCLNPKVLAGLALVGLVIWWTQPELIRSLLPVLLVLACPLSMVFMMRAMQRGGSSEERSAQADVTATAERVDRATELRRRLARAREEEDLLLGELTRLEVEGKAAADGGEQLPRAPSEEDSSPAL